MAPVATATAKSTTKPTAIADVTGAKKRGGKPGPRTAPMLTWDTPRLGAVTNVARAIAARNNGYVNAELIFRELSGHPEFEKVISGPNGSQSKAYDLLDTSKVKAGYKKALTLLETQGIKPHEDPENGGPKKGALPQLARVRTDVDTDEL